MARQRLRAFAANLRRDLPDADAVKVLVSGIVPSGKNQHTVCVRQSASSGLDPTFRYLDNLEWKPRCYDGAHRVKSAKFEVGRCTGKPVAGVG